MQKRILSLMLALAMMIGNGGAAFLSLKLGEGKVDLAKKTALVRSKAPVSDQQLKQVVRGLGYSPVAVEPA